MIVVDLFGIIVFVIAICAIVANELTFFATLLVVAGFGGLAWAGIFNVLSVVKAHPGLALAYAASYLVTGVVWSFIKWYFFVSARAKRFYVVKASWLKENNMAPDATFTSIQLHNSAYSSSKSELFDLSEAPKLSQHKSKVVSWMIYWPISVLLSIIQDFIKNLFNHIFETVKHLYEQISVHAYKDINLK